MAGRSAAVLAASLVWSGVTAFAAASLQPLSEQDMAKTHETGCNFLFDVGRQTRVFAIGSELMIRTTSGLSLCRPGDRAVADFFDGKRALACGGRLLRLTRAGKITGHQESDSSDWPATLTVTHADATQTIRGTAGTAC